MNLSQWIDLICSVPVILFAVAAMLTSIPVVRAFIGREPVDMLSSEGRTVIMLLIVCLICGFRLIFHAMGIAQ